MNANTQTDEPNKEPQLNLLSLVQQHHQLVQASQKQQQQNSTTGFSFDFVSTMATSQVCVDNHLLRPKLLKMIDTIQTYLDLSNEKLIEQIGKQREHELIDLARQSSDLTHRQKLQSLLIESINSNDLRKASFIHSFLGDQPIAHPFGDTYFNQTEDTNNTTSGNFITNNNANEADEEFNMNEYDSSTVKNEPYFSSAINSNNHNTSEHIEFDEDNHSHLHLPRSGSTFSIKPTNSQSCTSESVNITESIRDAFTKARKTNPLSPIRHLICSPGLEAKAQNCKIIILYRGRCNGVCYQNKPWSKEMHIHYIINTVNCNDHVSRLVKKQGIQFYNSFVLQNQDRIKQLIQMYKMEKV